jgi:hypothetical protein
LKLIFYGQELFELLEKGGDRKILLAVLFFNPLPVITGKDSIE